MSASQVFSHPYLSADLHRLVLEAIEVCQYLLGKGPEAKKMQTQKENTACKG
jgi:hypothetical protein